jgi:uncharacterized protein YbjT (DUF2867 family)
VGLAGPPPRRAAGGAGLSRVLQVPAPRFDWTTSPAELRSFYSGVNTFVFTHGSDGGGKAASESVDYGGVLNILAAIGSRRVRIALMTAIGVTNRTGSYNRSTEAHDWKRRSERLVRASGMPYTIVRPGWFDYNGPEERKLVLLQGDKRQSGTPSDGSIARRQLAEVLVRSLSSEQASRKTFELVSAKGPAQDDFNLIFAALLSDPEDALDAIEDTPNMPLDREPETLRLCIHPHQCRAWRADQSETSVRCRSRQRLAGRPSLLVGSHRADLPPRCLQGFRCNGP